MKMIQKVCSVSVEEVLRATTLIHGAQTLLLVLNVTYNISRYNAVM